MNRRLASVTRLARVLVATLAILVLLTVVAYAASPWLLSHWLKRELAAQGFQDVIVELGHPGWFSTTVHRLALSGIRGDRAFRFSASAIRVEHDITELPAGHVRRVLIPDATLHIEPATAREDPPAASALPIPALWTASFPLHELLVERLAIEWRAVGTPPFSGFLKGRIQRNADQLTSRWSLTENNRTLYLFHFDLAASGALTARLFRPEAPAAPLLHATVTVTPRGADRLAVHGKLDAQLQPLTPLLAPWLALPHSVREPGGRLVARWSGELPATTGHLARGTKIDGMLHLDATVAQWGELLQTGTVRMNADFALRGNVIRFRLQETMRLAAHLNRTQLALGSAAKPNQFVRTSKPTVVRAPQDVIGQITVQPNDIHLALAARTELVMDDLDTPDVYIPGLTMQLPAGLGLRYRPARNEWSSTGPTVLITAPAIKPQLAAVGTVEAVAIAAQIDPGSLARLPSLTVRHAGLTLLGGRLQSNNIRIDNIKTTHALWVDVEQLDLARVVALEQQQELEATGLLDGQLPIVLGPAGLRVESGRLRAAAPGGVIRYRPTDSFRSMADSNPNLKLVLQALSNYRYEKLDVGVDYAENGDLDLRVAVAGRNPDWNAGQPVNLNLNVSENIPMLLRSLRLADDIGAEVEKKARGKSGGRP